MLDIAPYMLVPAELLPMEAPNLPVLGEKTAVRALLVGDRIDTTALERDETLPTAQTLPLAVREEETAPVEVSLEGEDQIPPGGPIYVKDMAIERLLLVAYALADSVVLARDEREVSSVFDTLEPLARTLGEKGPPPGGRRAILKHIGNALLVQHRR